MDTVCLDCGAVTARPKRGAGLCPSCRRARDRARNASPKRQHYRDPAYLALPKHGVCWICGKPGADTRDHVIPLSRGGTNDPSNVRPAHRSCNSGRTHS